MTSWSEFESSAAEFGAQAVALLEGPSVVLLGTTRRDGWPRISPVEPIFVAGELWLGMTLGSMKARDLLRDPRCLVHNAVSDRSGEQGEIKGRGRAVEVTDPAQRLPYEDALFAKIAWRPEAPYNLFRIDVVDVAFVQQRDGAQHLDRWPV